MYPVSLLHAAKAMSAIPKAGFEGKESDFFPEVSIDSRSIRSGQAFFAIQGERHDGHRYIQDVMKRGSSIVVFSDQDSFVSSTDCTFLQVENTTKALQSLSNLIRRSWGRPVIAITGSMGKTTTRQFTASLLRSRYEVHETPGNFNNEFGLPLSLLTIQERHDLSVLELGMNRPGEIRSLVRICEPDAAMITNVAPVHTEYFADLDGITEAKGEILEGLPAKGTFFCNGDDKRVMGLADRHTGAVVSFGFSHHCDYRISDFEFHSPERMSFAIEGPKGRLESHVGFAGKHFLYNLVAAVAIASEYEVSTKNIEERLPTLATTSMRGKVIKHSGITVWDDSYNSNPEAVLSLLDTFSHLTGHIRRVIVLGDMLELGEQSERMHRKVGRVVAGYHPELLVTVGSDSRFIQEEAVKRGMETSRTLHFEDPEAASEELLQLVRRGDLVLVKGSRGIQMERIVKALGGSNS